MLPNESIVFTKENIEEYLKALAKEYRKRVKKSMPAEIVMVGGGAVLLNYAFRDSTNDMDALIFGSSAFSEAVNAVADLYQLEHGWLNADVRFTDSYSDKLRECSSYYKTFSGVLTIRTISAEYLVAMKLQAGRLYKHDISDMLGVLAAHVEDGKPILLEDIIRAYNKLYGSWETLPEKRRRLLQNMIVKGNYKENYQSTYEEEKISRANLIQFDNKYIGVLKKENVDEISQNLLKKLGKSSILASLLEENEKSLE